jgi:hypothetical protein
MDQLSNAGSPDEEGGTLKEDNYFMIVGLSSVPLMATGEKYKHYWGVEHHSPGMKTEGVKRKAVGGE